MRVTLKLATSLDGRIATASGESRWITGEAAREQVHKLRAMHQAVLIGVETAIADDPDLTVRLGGFVGMQPTRVVLDSRSRLPLTSKLVATAERLDTIVITTQDSNDRLTKAGVTVLTVPAKDGRCDPAKALEALSVDQMDRLKRRIGKSGQQVPVAMTRTDLTTAARAFGSVLIEGGGQVAASFLGDGLVDAIEWFRAPIILGDEGRPAVGEFVLDRLADAPRFKRTEVTALGDDLWERYERI